MDSYTGEPTSKDLHQLCADTGFGLEELLKWGGRMARKNQRTPWCQRRLDIENDDNAHISTKKDLTPNRWSV